MTRQEEVRDGMLQIVSEYGFRVLMSEGKTKPANWTDKLLFYLHSEGVVIKADRELPEDMWASPMNSVEHDAQQDMLRAGYVAVEPLVRLDSRHKRGV